MLLPTRIHALCALLLLPTSVALSHVPLGSAHAKSHCNAAVRLAHPAGTAEAAEAPTGWAAARTHRSRNVRCGLLSGLKVDGDDSPALEVGQRVRVTEQVTFMHVPGNKQGFAAQGAVGTVMRIYAESSLSPNREVKVEFEEPKRWIGHFESRELEPVSDESS